MLFFNNFVPRAPLVKERKAMNDKEFLEREIRTWKYSPERLLQIKGFRYFEGGHDILYRKRTVIGEGGELAEVENLPNNRIVDNQYGKLVLQKANYMGVIFKMCSENDT